jgi:HSP20 family protein
MKLEALPMSIVLVVVALPCNSEAYNVYSTGGSSCRPRSSFSNRDSFSGSRRFSRGTRGGRDRVEEAFRQLENEMSGGRKTDQFDFMMMDPTFLNFQEVDQEAVKKWVNKAFELASEFNQDFSQTDQERKTNDEFLKKSREWVEKMYTPPPRVDEKEAYTASPAAEAPEGTPGKEDPSQASENRESNEPQQPQEPEIITPYSENRSDKNTFMVAVDLPGVERSDVDLTLDNDFLVIEAKRRLEEEGESSNSRKYVKKFAVIEDAIEVDQISAALDRGVLTVSAPKKKREEKESKIKIPLT